MDLKLAMYSTYLHIICSDICRIFKPVLIIVTVLTGHLSAVRKWGGKTSDYAKSGGAKPKIHGNYK